MDELEFGKALAVLEDAYPRYTLEPRVVRTWYAILGDLDPNLLKAAVLQVASENRPFLPAPGEVRQCAFDLLDRQSDVPTAWDAWAEVTKRFGTHGHARLPEFSHPLIKRTVDGVGGWRELCMSTNAVADRARFVQAYETLAKRERAQSRMLPQVREVLELVGGKRRQAIEARVSECADMLRGDMRNPPPLSL